MMIIGLTGGNASGKGEAARYLQSKGFEYYSLSDILREEAKARHIEPLRENLIRLGNELREKNGPSVLADRATKKIQDKKIAFGGDFGRFSVVRKVFYTFLYHKKNYVIDSIRNPFEIKALRKLNGFILIGIDAPVETRFKRAVARKRPGDPETLEEFIEKEKKENIAGPANQQLENCLKAADILIINESNLEDFHKKIDEKIAEIQKTRLG